MLNQQRAQSRTQGGEESQYSRPELSQQKRNYPRISGTIPALAELSQH